MATSKLGRRTFAAWLLPRRPVRLVVFAGGQDEQLLREEAARLQEARHRPHVHAGKVRPGQRVTQRPPLPLETHTHAAVHKSATTS